NPFVSFGTRFVASERNATKRPPAEMEGPRLGSFPWGPPTPTPIGIVVPVVGSRTNTSYVAFVSFGTRFVAKDWNATKRPLAEIEAAPLPSSPWSLSDETLT